MWNTIAGFVLIGYMSMLTVLIPPQKTIYKTVSGSVRFKSVAPLETIQASSSDLKGIVDTVKNTFAFSVSINSFKGFNSPLQEQHFYENYMESTDFPVATFSGKIIEIIDYTKPGVYNVRAKGLLNIHGVKVESIIRGTVEVKNKQLIVKSTFNVSLQDHNIKIPRIVFQKIAPDITVEIEAILLPAQV